MRQEGAGYSCAARIAPTKRWGVRPCGTSVQVGGATENHRSEAYAVAMTNMTALSSWQFWAVLSAVFAALTAIFAKIGIENIHSDLATLIRTVVILITLTMIVWTTGQFQNPGTI